MVGLGVTLTTAVLVTVCVVPSQFEYTILAVYVVVTLGVTATDAAVLKFGLAGPDQFNVYVGAPVGVKRHASGVPFTEKVVLFLPGGQTATLAAAFCIPTIPYPLFHAAQETLLSI